jgi:hypothetical protein
MEEEKTSQLSVTGTGSTPLGTHLVDEEPMAVVDWPQTTFVRTLAEILGVGESWVLDHIIATYALRYGYDPTDDEPSQEGE